MCVSLLYQPLSHRFLLMVAITILLTGTNRRGQAQIPDDLQAGADSTVYALAVQTDGGIVMGGTFGKVAGQVRYGVARLQPDGALDNSFNPGMAGGSVYCAAVQPDRRIILGGSFNYMASQTHRNIARINPDGTPDSSFTTTISNVVNCMVLQPDGKILVGGSFTGISGQIRRYLARLTETGALDTSFNPSGDGQVHTIALQPNGQILAGGRFASVGGLSGAYLARVNASGAVDTTYYPGPDNWVYGIAVQPDGRAVVAGRFTYVGWQSAPYICRLEDSGAVDTTFVGGADATVYSVALQADGKIVVGGSFTNLNGQVRNRIGRLTPNGSLDTTFNPGATGTVYAVSLQRDGKVLVGGSFTNVSGLARTNFARLTNPDPATENLAFSTSKITWLRGGSSPEGWRTEFAVTTNGTIWSQLGSGVPVPGGWELSGLSLPAKATVRARAMVTGGRYSGSSWLVESMGGYPRILTQPANRTNDATTTASFTAEVIGSSGSLQWYKGGAPVVDGGKVFGAGTPRLVLTNVFGAEAGDYTLVFSNWSGIVTSHVARLTVIDPLIRTNPAGFLVNVGEPGELTVSAIGTDLRYQWHKNGTNLPGTTGTAVAFTPVTWDDRGFYEVVLSNAFGCVTSAVAEVAVNLATPDAFASRSDGVVSAVAEQTDGNLVFGGGFSAIAGQAQRYLGRVRSDGSFDPTFLPKLGQSWSGTPGVWSVAMQTDGRMMVAGDFMPPDGRSTRYAVRLNGDGTLDPGFVFSAYDWIMVPLAQPDGRLLLGGSSLLVRVGTDGVREAGFEQSIFGYIRSMALQPDGKIVAGGYISSVNSQSVTNLVRFNANGTLDTNFLGWASNEVYAISIQADGKILVGGAFTELNGQTRNYFGRLNPDGSLDYGFNPAPNGLAPGASYYSQPNVSSIALQANGKIIIAGMFTNVCGAARTCLARLNPDGSLDPTFNAWAENGTADWRGVAVLKDGRILAIGEFTRLAGKPISYLGRLNNPDAATESLSLNGGTISWMRGGSSPELYGAGFDYCADGNTWIMLGNGVRQAGGWKLAGVSVPTGATLRARGFVSGGKHNTSSWYIETTLGGPVFNTQPASRTNNAGTLASFDVTISGASPLACAWLKNGVPMQEGGNVFGAHLPTLCLSNVLHLDAGSYSVVVSNISGVVTSSVAVLTVIDPVINQHPTNIYTWGGSSVSLSVSAAGTSLQYQWRKDGVAVPGATDPVLNFFGVQGAQAGGYDVVVSNAYGVLESARAMLTVNTIQVDSFSAGTDGEVSDVVRQPDGKIIVAGDFSLLANISRTDLGRLSAGGGIDTSFNPAVSGFSVHHLALQPDGHILIGGYFFQIGGQIHTRMGRINSNGTLDTTFNYFAENWHYAFTIQPDGAFLVSSDPERLRRFNADGTIDGSFQPSLAGSPNAVAVLPDGDYLVGPALGSFKSLIRLRRDGSPVSNFNVPLEGLNTSAHSLIIQPDGKILVGGFFDRIGGESRTNLARLNPDGSVDASFCANANSWIGQMALQADGKIVVVGSFSTIGGYYRTNIARLYPDGSVDPVFNPGANDSLNTICMYPYGAMVVGGRFTRLGGVTRNRLGLLQNDQFGYSTLALEGSDITWMRSGAVPEVWAVQFAISTNGTSWKELGAGARIPGGWQLGNVLATTNATIRARGFVSGAQWFLEETVNINALTRPKLWPRAVTPGSTFGCEIRALPGQTVVIESSTNLTTWSPVSTNLVGSSGGFIFEDLTAVGRERTFYRANVR